MKSDISSDAGEFASSLSTQPNMIGDFAASFVVFLRVFLYFLFRKGNKSQSDVYNT